MQCSDCEIPICAPDGQEIARLRISCLSETTWNGIPLLRDVRSEPGPRIEAGVQLLEESSYDYEVVAPDRVVTSIEPPEVISSSQSIHRGRLTPGRIVGTVVLRITFSDGALGTGELEVRSRKLRYDTEYRSMLGRIAAETAELAQSAFAAGQLRSFQPDPSGDPITLYQRFAFIKALFESEQIQDALDLVTHRPHFEHVTLRETTNPAHGAPGSSRLARDLCRAGPRQPLDPPIGSLTTLPRHVHRVTHTTTYDTVPNRFVRYVLESWRATVEDVRDALNGRGPALARGRRETTEILDRIETALQTPAIREAGALASFPQSNQVLQGRVGYRDLLEGFLLAEVAPSIDWDAATGRYSAGVRDVAELYEYWTYLEIIRILKELPDAEVDHSQLLKLSSSGLSLELRRGSSTNVRIRLERRGVGVLIEVSYNPTFKGNSPDRSWSIGMHPDISISLTLEESDPLSADSERPPVWIHFDAKYRVETFNVASLVAEEEADVDDEDPGTRPRSSDVMKMHAYHDAIISSLGAYVLYPGAEDDVPLQRRRYHEVVPGVGAFALRPQASGFASFESSNQLRLFIDDIVDHVSARGTAIERLRYWTQQSIDKASTQRLSAASFLRRPAQDTRVLLGPVHSVAHLEWILSSARYDLALDNSAMSDGGLDTSLLAADLLLLYGGAGELPVLAAVSKSVTFATPEHLSSSGYPSPGTSSRLLIPLSFISTDELPSNDDIQLRALTHQEGSTMKPVVLTWFDIVAQPEQVLP